MGRSCRSGGSVGEDSNTSATSTHPGRWRRKTIDTIGVLGALVGLITGVPKIPEVFGYSGWNLLPDSPPILNLLSLVLLLSACVCLFLHHRQKRQPGSARTRRFLIAFISLFAVGIVLAAVSLFWPPPSGGNSSDERTFIESVHPAPERYQVQRDGSTATVSGVEMQAKSCPQESSSFDITALEQGDRVSFSLKGYPGDSASGSYAVTAQGAGISENYRISDGAIQRIQATAREKGDLNITISAQHRPELGSSCNATSEVLAIDDAILN